MRQIAPEPFEVFKLDELDVMARERAIGDVAGKLGGEWWDSHDIDDVSDTITYILAEALRTPGWDTFGEGDFPGIPNVEVRGWDVDRGGALILRGTLNRDNAPALPWEGIEFVLLEPGVHGTDVGVVADDDAAVHVIGAMQDAVRDAIGKALDAGRRQVEYIGSEENAEEYIIANEREFFADGSLYEG